jgi:hypothetical protein
MNNSIFTGRRRRGKTTRAFHKARKDGSLVIVFDPKREFLGWPATCKNVSDVMNAIDDGNVVIIFHPDNVEEDFTTLANFVWAIHEFGMEHGWQNDKNHKPIVFLVDEAHQLQSANTINSSLKSIMQKARPEILVVFQTTQSPTYLYSASKIANSEYYFFYTTYIPDLERIAKTAGDDVALAVANLKQNRFYVWFSEDDQTYEVVTDSDSWNCDLIYNESKEEKTVAKKKITVSDGFLDKLAKRVKEMLKDDRSSPSQSHEDNDEEIELVIEED